MTLLMMLLLMMLLLMMMLLMMMMMMKVVVVVVVVAVAKTAVSNVEVVAKLPTATTMIDTLRCDPAEQTIGVSS
jgi:hypothetical protein